MKILQKADGVKIELINLKDFYKISGNLKKNRRFNAI